MESFLALNFYTILVIAKARSALLMMFLSIDTLLNLQHESMLLIQME